MVNPGSLKYSLPRRSEMEMLQRAEDFKSLMSLRRSVRQFSPEPVPRELIELAIATASTAPSGAHRQPWRFVAIDDPATKRRIRIAAEAEEWQNYEGGRMPPEWRSALAPIGTDWQKPFLEIAPWIVVIFEETYGITADGTQRPNYYVKESVGICCGLFLTALHNMGLAALTHTLSPMAFLSEILHRPKNERPFLLIPIGYPNSPTPASDTAAPGDTTAVVGAVCTLVNWLRMPTGSHWAQIVNSCEPLHVLNCLEFGVSIVIDSSLHPVPPCVAKLSA